VSGRYVQYLGFLQDLEQLVMAAQEAQVGQSMQQHAASLLSLLQPGLDGTCCEHALLSAPP
jgi:hypothetical protein